MDIVRPKTERERTEYKDLKQADSTQVLLARMSEHAQENYVKKHKPYCRKCCQVEFELKTHMIKSEQQLKLGYTITDEHPLLIKAAQEFDVDKYGATDGFDVVGDTVRTEKKLVGANMWVDIVIIEKTYACKKYGHKCIISVPKEELEHPVKVEKK